MSSPKPSTMAELESLPFELLLLIMEEIPDLPTLYTLIRASPRAAHVFDQFSVHILEPLINRSLSEGLRQYPRWLAVVGSLETPSSPFSTTPSTLESFTTNYRAKTARRADRERLARDLAGTAGPRHALVAAHLVQRLEHICLARMLGLLHDLAAPQQPHCPAAPPGLLPQGGSDDTFEVAASRAPSWVERFRVQEALWRILAGSYASRIPGLPKEGVSRENREVWHEVFEPWKPLELVIGDWSWGYQRGDPLDCVHDTLHDFLGCSPTKLFTGRASEAEGNRARDRLSAPPAGLLLEDSRDWEHDEPQPLETEEGDILGQSERHITCANYGERFYLLNYHGAMTSGSASRRDFRAISRLGLSIWDTQRLLQTGLAQRPSGRVRRGSQSEEISDECAEKFNAQARAWRSVILQEMARVEGTPLGDEVLSPGCHKLLETGTKLEAIGNAHGAVRAPVTPTTRRPDETYDGPAHSTEMGEWHNDVVVQMMNAMEMEQAAYDGRGAPVAVDDDDMNDDDMDLLENAFSALAVTLGV